MLALCLGTLLAGALGAALVPFLPFAVTVIVTAVFGVLIAAAHGRLGLSVLGGAVVLVVFTQIGYAIGLAYLSFGVGRRRDKPMVSHLDRSVAEVLGGPGQARGGSNNPQN